MSWTDLYVSRGITDYVTDKDTNITTGYDRDGNIVYESRDEDGNGNNEYEIFYNGNNRQYSIFDNNTGLLSSKTYYENDEALEEYTYNYDEMGRLTEEFKDCQCDGSIDYTTYYKYNELGESKATTINNNSIFGKIYNLFS